MPAEVQRDAFLSHNQADKPRVRRLAERLRAAGLRQSNFALRTSNFGLGTLCLSPAALGSGWVTLGRSTVGRGNLPFRDPSNAGRRFIPLLLADCKLPDGLGSCAAGARDNSYLKRTTGNLGWRGLNPASAKIM